jgi:hypothetical protein
MTRGIRRAWQHAIAAANALTVPRPDVAASDRAVELALRDSRLFRIVDAAGTSGHCACRHARMRTWLRRLAAEWAAWPGAERVRAAGVCVAVAGLTVLLAEAATPVPAGPLAWVLPAALAGLGVVAAIAADPLARAIADKTS